MIVQNFYADLNFASSNLLDSAAGGTFMEITLGEATKLLENIYLSIPILITDSLEITTLISN